MANLTVLSPIGGTLLTHESISRESSNFLAPFHHFLPHFKHGTERLCRLLLLPHGGTLYSPLDGTVQVSDTVRGLFFISSKSGIPLLLRLCHTDGTPLPALPEALLSLVNSGASVRAGQVIARADLAVWRRAGWDPRLQLLILLPDIYRALCQARQCEGGRTPLLLLQRARRRQAFSRRNTPYKNSP